MTAPTRLIVFAGLFVFTSAAMAAADRGPELLRAAIAQTEVDASAAAKSLDALAKTSPVIEDYVLYFDAIAHRKLGEAKPAVAALEKLLGTYDGSPVAVPAAAELVDLNLASGNPKKVLALAERYEKSKRPADAVLRIKMAAGQVVADKDPKRAAAYYASARRLAPDSRSARLAGDALRRIRLQHPDLSPKTPDELLEEAAYLTREARLTEQGRLIDRFLRTYPGHGRRHTAVMLRARGIAATKGKAAAADYLMDMVEKTAGAQAKARLVFEAALFDWNANLNTEALEKFQTVLHMKTGIAEEQRAHYASGRIHESKRRYNAAAKAYRAAAAGPNGRLSRDSEWRAGWVSYLAGNYDGAAFVFARMAAQAGAPDRSPGKPHSTVPTGREDALYWQARSLERSGAEQSSMAVYAKLLKESPDGFYAYLVEKRKGLRTPPPKPQSIPSQALTIPADLERALARSAALHRAGLDRYIQAELDPILKKQPGPQLRLLLPRLSAIGAYTVAMRKSLDLYRRGIVSEQELYPYLYPHAFVDIVSEAAVDHGISPFLIYALMRQESAFNTQAVSYARACGLMQLLPSTAESIAKQAGVTVHNCRDLFNPQVNIKLGATYLAQLGRLFHSNPVLMLAGYNAGENAASRWQSRNAGMAEDEFIEHISYRETRNYVKKVLRNYRNYARLYGQPTAARPLAASAEGIGKATR